MTNTRTGPRLWADISDPDMPRYSAERAMVAALNAEPGARSHRAAAVALQSTSVPPSEPDTEIYEDPHYMAEAEAVADEMRAGGFL